jgi:hypothetical protein
VSDRFPRQSSLITADVDLGRIRQERMKGEVIYRENDRVDAV